MSCGVDVERRIVDAGGEIGERREHHRAAFVLEQFGVGRRALEDGALRREVAEQRHQAAGRLERLVGVRDDRAVDVAVGIAFEALAERFAGHRHAVEMQQRLELAQQRAHAAGGVKVFHVAVADRLEIDQHGRRIRQRVEMIERDFHAGAAGDRGQMNDARWSSRRARAARAARSRPTSR